jgi:hypothetical protein
MGTRPLLRLINDKGETIKYYDLPTPSEYRASTATLVDTGRNSMGQMIGSVVRAGVTKIDLQWRYLKPDDWADLLNQFSGKDNFIRQVEFYDQATGDWEVKEFYVSDRTSAMDRRDVKTGLPRGWRDCKLSLVEV